MIVFIEGIVRMVRDQSVVIQTSGLGYEVWVPRPTLERCTVGTSVALHTVLQVREDAWTLFGFHHPDLQQLFELLLTVSGVGGKLALNLLSQLSSQRLATALLSGDVASLTQVTGVGKKTAERLILELQSKVPAHLQATGGKEAQVVPSNPYSQDAIDALITLGYREPQVRQVVAELLRSHPEADADFLIRRSLGKLR